MYTKGIVKAVTIQEVVALSPVLIHKKKAIMPNELPQVTKDSILVPIIKINKPFMVLPNLFHLIQSFMT